MHKAGFTQPRVHLIAHLCAVLPELLQGLRHEQAVQLRRGKRDGVHQDAGPGAGAERGRGRGQVPEPRRRLLRDDRGSRGINTLARHVETRWETHIMDLRP